jgi:hypothetical protein
MTKTRRRTVAAALLTLGLIAAAAMSPGHPLDLLHGHVAARVEAQEGTATITGKILFNGEAPELKKIKMSADPACKAMHSGEVFPQSVVVNENGTLRWVMVYVSEGAAGQHEPPGDPVVLDQVGCIYEPHVFTIMAGQPLEIRNSDEVLHNVHSLPETNKPFNIAQPVKGMKTSKSFEKPEVPIRIKCDVHPWMACYAGVFDHPFHAVTGEDGSYEIGGLPPGDYVIETWHETYGNRSQKVSVAAGETKAVNIAYEAGS